MSGNLLSKNHPFRASITHGEAEIASSTSVTAPTAAQNDEKPNTNITFSTKTKLISLAITGLIITYGWLQIYDSIYPPSHAPIKEKGIKKESTEKISYEEVTDFEWGISDIALEDELQSKPGWFNQTFCKGVKRSFFCR